MPHVDNRGKAGVRWSSYSVGFRTEWLREEDDGNQCYQHTHFQHPELEQNHEIGTLYGGNMSAFDEASTVITDDTWRGPASSSSSPSGSSCR
ncbi:hypothetical protein ACFX15_022294 [Malus domestica]